MKKFTTKIGTTLALIAALTLAPFMSACNSSSGAQKAETAIAVAVSVAQADIALVPVQDQPAYTAIVTGVSNLNTQLATCISNVSGLTGKSAKFLSCFNVFAQGLASPTELAQFRLLSANTQHKVAIYEAAVVAAVNIAVAAYGGTSVQPPTTTTAAPVPTQSELAPLENQMREAAGL